MKYRPLDSLESFELIQAMFPERITDDNDLGDEESVIVDEFTMDPDDFNRLVGMLVHFAPIMQSPLTKKIHHVLGKVSISGENSLVTAFVKREYQPDPEE